MGSSPKMLKLFTSLVLLSSICARHYLIETEGATSRNEAYDEYDDYDVGVSLNQLNAALLKGGIKPSAKITEKFHELDTNKDGLLEKSEVTSATEGGQDYFLFTLIAAAVAAAAGAAAGA